MHTVYNTGGMQICLGTQDILAVNFKHIKNFKIYNIKRFGIYDIINLTKFKNIPIIINNNCN